MKNILIVLFTLLSISSDTNAKNISDGSSDSSIRTISVMGYATKKIEPNCVYLKFKITEQLTKENYVSINDVHNKIQTVLKKQNIPAKSLTTNAISGYENYNYNSEQQLNYYHNRSYVLKLNSIDAVDSFILNVHDLKLDELQIVSFDNSLILSYARDVQIEAFKNGKEKAESLLSIYNEELGEVVEIKEVQAHVIWPSVYGQKGNLNYSVFVSDESFYDVKQIISKFEQDITLEYQVKLTFKIK